LPPEEKIGTGARKVTKEPPSLKGVDGISDG